MISGHLAAPAPCVLSAPEHGCAPELECFVEGQALRDETMPPWLPPAVSPGGKPQVANSARAVKGVDAAELDEAWKGSLHTGTRACLCQH